ncbi:MAG: DUF4956 domain-containing protein [Ignavibacteriales bacterium]|nr:DUF4956 domain-containing protein [Ignavibacteriales bacterium]
MDSLQTFQDFLATNRSQIPIVAFIFNLLLTAILSLILAQVYFKYGNSLSNRKLFGRNFLSIAMTTMLIITVVKSSLALSLGLVGALSIIRFRAAIKEPEELSYLFLAISIGLGFGADQGVITIAAFIVITLMIIIIKKISRKAGDEQNLHLTISVDNPKVINVEEIVDTLKTHCSTINLKRVDETAEFLEASFLVEFDDFQQFNETKQALQKLDGKMKILFLDNRGVSSL